MAEPILLMRTHVPHSRTNSSIISIHAEPSEPFEGTYEKLSYEIRACQRAGVVLHREYPGHRWAARADIPQGYMQIGIPELLGPTIGEILLFHIDVSDRAFMRAGGAILERFKIPRSGFDEAHYQAAMRMPLIGNFRARDLHRIPT